MLFVGLIFLCRAVVAPQEKKKALCFKASPKIKLFYNNNADDFATLEKSRNVGKSRDLRTAPYRSVFVRSSMVVPFVVPYILQFVFALAIILMHNHFKCASFLK